MTAMAKRRSPRSVKSQDLLFNIELSARMTAALDRRDRGHSWRSRLWPHRELGQGECLCCGSACDAGIGASLCALRELLAAFAVKSFSPPLLSFDSALRNPFGND